MFSKRHWSRCRIDVERFDGGGIGKTGSGGGVVVVDGGGVGGGGSNRRPLGYGTSWYSILNKCR